MKENLHSAGGPSIPYNQTMAILIKSPCPGPAFFKGEYNNILMDTHSKRYSFC